VNGTEWDVEAVVSVTDGDTLRLIRSRVIELDGRRYRLTDEGADGVPIRLVWVNTPERGKEHYKAARYDLMAWAEHLSAGPLRVVCYESAGWDRLLGDLIDATGASASQWLMRERGWPAYEKGKR
jgi:endonuclease YncB( thermonuclease family)